ncbi:MAG: HemK/PrmC family methyltransferase [Minisyncoccota bacterium]
MTRDEQWLLEEKYSGKASAAFEEDCKRLARGEPLAYVIGWQPFLGLKINLDSHPLIPRPETEWWTEQLMSTISGTLRRSTDRAGGTFSTENDSEPRNRTHELRLLDLCAGSGAIGCAALARLPNAHVSFGEIDPAHEATILKNIHENRLDEARALIRIGDLFAPFDAMRFDIIAANPPYIPSERALPKSVVDYEPARALFSGNDGLELIRRIAAELSLHLAPGGEAWIECDETFADMTAMLFRDQGFRALIRTDQYRTPRLVVVSFP